MQNEPEITAVWSRYRLVRPDGVWCRLLKMRAFRIRGVRCFRIRDAAGSVLDEEPVPPNAMAPWAFGFWMPEADAPAGYAVEAVGPEGRSATIEPGPMPEGDALPLRLDRTGPWLREHLLSRESLPEADALLDTVPPMGDYLGRHRIVFRRPAAHWSEGLCLGNGSMGAVVTNPGAMHQRFHLDRCDIWAASEEGWPAGRAYAGVLDLSLAKFGGEEGTGAFFQELDLHEAEVRTRTGDWTMAARVHASRDVLEVELEWHGKNAAAVTMKVSRETFPLIGKDRELGAICNGSWLTVAPPERVQAAHRAVASAARTEVKTECAPDGAALVHRLPTMTYAMAIRAEGPPVEWSDASEGRSVAVQATATLKPGGVLRLLVGTASDRESDQPVEEARRRCKAEMNGPGHREWWEAFWRRTFIELPDKAMENLWYHGVFQQAVFSRSLQAPGFFALAHPLDYRTWDDAYVADAQTALMWWAPLASNHLELMLPSHSTFARMLPEFLEHNVGRGALVPHHFFPEWAGGHSAFGTANPYKGSVGWLALNFWRDYQLTGDQTFLAGVAYPVIAACADFHLGDLIQEEDGCLHCLKSGAPEQEDTERDNAYDHASVTAVLRAAVEAAQTLRVDEARRAAWQEALGRLFPLPQDETTLWETAENHHPYRCHPVVLFGVHPMGTIEPGQTEWEKARVTYRILTNLLAYHFQDRHEAIPGHEGAVEPNGHATAFLMHSAARLFGWQEVHRLFFALTARSQLKPNGLLSICDPRHEGHLCHMAISEALSGQTSGLSEVLVQDYSDHVRVFHGAGEQGTFRFAGLRARGGFILAGEHCHGRTIRIVVHSLRGATLRLANPWPGREPEIVPAAPCRENRTADGMEVLVLETEPGCTYQIQNPASEGRSEPLQEKEARQEPRAIRWVDWDEEEPPVAYYPEDPPFAQEPDGKQVYLGRAAKEGGGPALPDRNRALVLVEERDWRARQTGARWLGHTSEPEAMNRLRALAIDDPIPVVRYTAGVSLVWQGTPEALGTALAIAQTTDLPHQRREILKAVSRMARTVPGKVLLKECWRNLAWLDNLWG